MPGILPVAKFKALWFTDDRSPAGSILHTSSSAVVNFANALSCGLPSSWSLNVHGMLVQMLLDIRWRTRYAVVHVCGYEEQAFPSFLGDCFPALDEKLKFSLQVPSTELFLPFLNPSMAYIFTSMIAANTLTDSGVNYLLYFTVLCFLDMSLS